jgi:hypothetical protein
MGSSYSKSYYGTKEQSQPYLKSYHVTSEMLEYDKQRGVYDGSYSKNPTAINITTSNIDYIYGKEANGNYTYVVNLEGEIIVGKRNGNGRDGVATPHPTLIGGEDPQVKVAGIVTLKNGKIVSFDHMSGHYKPNIKSMKEAKEAFGKLPKELFSKDYKGGKQ